jgi:hypothetical protein
LVIGRISITPSFRAGAESLVRNPRALARKTITSVSFHELIITNFLFGLKPVNVFWYFFTPGLKARVSDQLVIGRISITPSFRAGAESLVRNLRALARKTIISVSFHELIITNFLFGLKPVDVFWYFFTPGLKARVNDPFCDKQKNPLLPGR